MKHLHLIHQDKPELQLREFTSNLGSCIPIIAPRKLDDSIIEAVEIPKEADFAVASSGTTGKPKLYFRTKRSLTDFFPEQNELFSINSGSRIFIHGSLAFTGNLNIAYEAVENGAFLHCESSFRAQVWAEEILKNRIDTIYLIPDKLLHLVRHGIRFENIRTIICGSQFIGEKLFEMTRFCFPNAKIILYYGSSEVNYVSYNVLNEKPAHENCVGKIFDSIKVKFSPEGNILVNSPFSVCGISGYYDTKDKGYLKDGLLYLNGRSDDQLNILGEKINAYKINGCFRFTTSKNVKSAWKKRIQRKLSSPTYQEKIFHHLCQIQFLTESLPFSFLKNTSTMKNFQETKAENLHEVIPGIQSNGIS